MSDPVHLFHRILRFRRSTWFVAEHGAISLGKEGMEEKAAEGIKILGWAKMPAVKVPLFVPDIPPEEELLISKDPSQLHCFGTRVLPNMFIKSDMLPKCIHIIGWSLSHSVAAKPTPGGIASIKTCGDCRFWNLISGLMNNVFVPDVLAKPTGKFSPNLQAVLQSLVARNAVAPTTSASSAAV